MALVFIHVSGPYGVGKTTLLKRIRQEYPDLKYICLDSYENIVKEQLGLKKGWRHHGGWEKYRDQVREIRRRAFKEDMDKYGNKPRKIIMFDTPFEGDDEVEFDVDAEHKILLTRPLEEIVRDRIKRDSAYALKDPERYQELVDHHSDQTKKHMRWNLSYGYQPMTPDQAYEFMKSKLEDKNRAVAAKIANLIY